MANMKSARKRARQSLKRRSHNVSQRSEARSAIRNVKQAISAGDKAAAAATFEKSRSVIDGSAAKGVLHRNAAARHKSRLARAIKSMA